MKKSQKTDFPEEVQNKTITAKTGQKCPVSGEWEVIGTVTTVVVLSKNQVMPDYMGSAVVWQLIRKN